MTDDPFDGLGDEASKLDDDARARARYHLKRHGGGARRPQAEPQEETLFDTEPSAKVFVPVENWPSASEFGKRR